MISSRSITVSTVFPNPTSVALSSFLIRTLYVVAEVVAGESINEMEHGFLSVPAPIVSNTWTKPRPEVERSVVPLAIVTKQE